ncbi:MAG: hypothetical protein ACREJC_15840 [Tepidisphaeraceae bacterium]
MKKDLTPTQRTVARLKWMDYQIIEVVEHRIRGGKTKDLFGGDVLAVRGFLGVPSPCLPTVARAIPMGNTLLVQCTSRSNHASRVTKLRNLPTTYILLAAGWDIEVWGWLDGVVRVTQMRDAFGDMPARVPA